MRSGGECATQTDCESAVLCASTDAADTLRTPRPVSRSVRDAQERVACSEVPQASDEFFGERCVARDPAADTVYVADL